MVRTGDLDGSQGREDDGLGKVESPGLAASLVLDDGKGGLSGDGSIAALVVLEVVALSEAEVDGADGRISVDSDKVLGEGSGSHCAWS